MKRTKHILLAAVLSAFAIAARAQQVSFPGGTSLSAGEVVAAIEAQTDFSVSYNRNTFDAARGVTLPAPTMELRPLLEAMTEGSEVNYIVSGHFIALTPAPKPKPIPVPVAAPVEVPEELAVVEPEPVEVPAPPMSDPEESWFSDYREPAVFGRVQSALPRFAVKTNLLYGLATLTPNIGVEVGLTPKSTVELTYSNNPWHEKRTAGGSNKKLLHGIVAAEYRYWLCERFSGHFVGGDVLYSQYNVSGHNIPLLFKAAYRYRGWAVGAGATYGYNLPVNRWLNVELTAGLGLVYLNYDRFSCRTCDTNAVPSNKLYFGPTQLGINLVFLIK